MNNTLKLAVILLATYGVLILVNAGFYASWSNDFSEFHRVAIRILGVILIVFGLMKKANWAWWLAILGTGALVVLGGLASMMVLLNDVYIDRPYPRIDMVFLFSSLSLLTLAFLVLLMPSARKAIISKQRVKA